MRSRIRDWRQRVPAPETELRASALLECLQREHQRMLLRLSEAANSTPRAYRQAIRGYLLSDAAKIVAYDRAVTRRERGQRRATRSRRAPAPIPMSALQRVARGLRVDPFSQRQRRALVRQIPKSHRPGTRTIWRFDDDAAAEQIMVAQALKPQARWDGDQYLLNGGVPRCCSQVLSALRDATRTHVLRADIADCFQSFDDEVVVNTLPLPPLVTRNVVLASGYVPYGDVSTTSTGGRGVVLAGIPGGSACSSYVAETLLAPIIDRARRALADRGISGVVFVYADDFLFVTTSEEGARGFEQALRDGMDTIATDSLRLGNSGIYAVSDGFEYLRNQFGMTMSGGPVAAPLNEDVWAELNGIERALAWEARHGRTSQIPDEIEERIRGVEGAYRYSRGVMWQLEEILTDYFEISV